jgi:branched-chain amino acid transport system substrate-binding protein
LEAWARCRPYGAAWCNRTSWNKHLIGLACAATLIAAPAIAAEKLRIGFITTLSGGAAIIGAQQKNGMDLGMEMLGGKLGGLEVELIYEDDKRGADAGRKAADKLIKKDKVHFVLGPIWSNVLMAIQKPVLRSGTFLISTNAGASPMAGKNCHKNYFTTSWNNDQMPEAMGELVQRKGIKNTFLMAPNYQAGKDMLAGFSRFYKGDIKGRILTKLGQKDYQAELSQVRAAGPEALFIFEPGGMGIAFMKQWAASGLAKQIKLFTVFTIDYLTLPAIGDAAIGTFHTNYWRPDSDVPANKKFIAAYKAKYGKMPSHFAAQSYDAPFLIDSAIRAVNGDLSNKDGIRAALEKADFESVRGPFTYNVNHHPIQSYYERQVVKGPDGKPMIVTKDVVFENKKDSYYKECKM